MSPLQSPHGADVERVDNPLAALAHGSGGGSGGGGGVHAAVLFPPGSESSKRRRELMLDDEVLAFKDMEPRQYVTWRYVVYWLAAVLTGGTSWIIANWPFMTVKTARCLSRRCKQAHADFFVFKGCDDALEVCPVEVIAKRQLELLAGSERRAQYAPPRAIPADRRMVVYRHARFLFDAAAGVYRQLDVTEYTHGGASTAAAAAAGGGVAGAGGMTGLTAADAAARLATVGQNVIEVPIPPVAVLLLRECIHPFVIFQVWAVIVWLTEAYWAFSAFIFVAAILTAVMNFWEVRKNLLEIQGLSKYTTTVRALRDGAALTLSSADLVPGDLLLVDADAKMPCDAVLLRGQCTVNEAMLTGETTVVVKQPVEGAAAVADAATRHTLFGGSLVVQLRVPRGDAVVAMVVRTGFESVKGRLVLSILYPRPTKFKFMRQSFAFIGVLFVLAMVGFGVNARALSSFGADAGKIVQRGCDMITIVVPPALPLALTIGVAYALLALRRDRISCISPPRVNLAGKVNCFCFDKTGTLTTEGLSLLCIRGAAGGAFTPAAASRDAVAPAMVRLLATCHSLTEVKGVLSGDPLEVQTFAFTRATLAEPHTSGGLAADVEAEVTLPLAAGSERFAILHRNEFVPALQRMSCLVAAPGGGVLAVVKGSPEALAALCRRDTLPPDYYDVLAEYTRQGLRVLGAGYKEYAGATRVAAAAGATADALRDAAERDLCFLGFIVLENALKDATTPTITALRTEAGLTMAMVTGDNAVAAVAVARKCTLVEAGYRVYIGDVAGDGGGVAWTNVDDAADRLDAATLTPAVRPAGGGGGAPYRLAMTGRAFTHLLDQLAHRAGGMTEERFARAILNCTVFARMSPDAKAALVERYQATGLHVGMIGDGANDSLALRAAHVGISLSQVEASVSAPFTSHVPDISAVPRVLAEGRGALATSFCLFQFMALYSTIQFANALFIVFADSFLSNNEYLYQDLFVVLVLSLTMGGTPSARRLTRKRPSGNLLSGYNLTLCAGFIAATLAAQLGVFLHVRAQPWCDTPAYPAAMNPDDDAEGTNSAIPETTTVFLMAMLQYVAVAAIFSIGYPWKAPTWRNLAFSAWLALVTGVSIFIYVAPTRAVYDFIGLQVLPLEWHLQLFGWSVASFASYFVFVAAAYTLRRRGAFKALACAPCRRPAPLHKRARSLWQAQFNVPYLGAPVPTSTAKLVPNVLRAARAAAAAGTGTSGVAYHGIAHSDSHRLSREDIKVDIDAWD